MLAALRTEIAEGGPVIATPKRRAKTDDGPQPPKTNWNLEGVRALYEGRAIAYVQAERADEIRSAVEIFNSYEVPFVILGGREADKVADLAIVTPTTDGTTSGAQEAVKALVALGYSFSDADDAVRTVLEDGTPDSTEELIRRALATG